MNTNAREQHAVVRLRFIPSLRFGWLYRFAGAIRDGMIKSIWLGNPRSRELKINLRRPHGQSRCSHRVYWIANVCVLAIGSILVAPNSALASRADDEANGFVSNLQWRWVPLYVPYITPPYSDTSGGGPFYYDNGYDFAARAVADAQSALSPHYRYCGAPPLPGPKYIWLYPHCNGGVDGWLYLAGFADSAQPGESLLQDSKGVYFYGKCPTDAEMRHEGTGVGGSSNVDPTQIYCFVRRKDDQCNSEVPLESGKFGNPCDAASGNKSQTERDYAGKEGIPSFTRYYHSHLKRDVGLGVGWTSPFHKRLVISGWVYVQRGNGYAETFNCSTTSCNGQYSVIGLTKDAAGYTIRERDGSTERYDTTGALQTESDHAGNIIASYSYDANGRLTSVTGRYGHSFYLSYHASGHLATLTDPTGAIYSYVYDAASNLVRVNYPDGAAKLYHYERSDLPNALTGISYVDTTGNVTRHSAYGYDTAGLATSTELAGGIQRFTLSYDSPLQTTVTDAVGTQQVLTFRAPSSSFLTKSLVTKTYLSDGKAVTQQFNSSNEITCKQDEEGRVTTYNYQTHLYAMTEGQSGNCTNPVATPVTRTTTYQYVYDHPTYVLALPTVISKPSVYNSSSYQKTTITYDGARRPTNPIASPIASNGETPSATTRIRA